MLLRQAGWTGTSAIMTVLFPEYKDSTGLVRLPAMLSIRYSMLITTYHCGKDNWLRHTLQSLEPPFLVCGCPSVSPVHVRAVRFTDLGYFFPKFLDTL